MLGLGCVDTSPVTHVLFLLLLLLQTRAKQLTIEDCPLLPAGFQLQLLGVDGQPLTLQQLEGDAWWELLEQPCRDKWRRHAGWGGADKYVFTPSFEDLQVQKWRGERRASIWYGSV
jgi:hypothetical protein